MADHKNKKQNETVDAGLCGNEKIEEAIAALQQEPTQEMLAHTLTVIRRRMQENGQFIVAVEPPTGDGQIRVQAIKTADGKAWWAAFTSFEEELKGGGSVKSTFLANIDKLFASALTVPEIAGVIINPWNGTDGDQDRMKQKEERNNVMKKANETVVLCGASAYEEKYYLNPQFSKLPEHIRQELQIMCVLYTQKVGGILMLEFTPEGHLEFKTEAKENDFFYDEIGSVLEIKKLQNEKRELMEALEMFYRVVFLGEEFDYDEA